MSPRDSKFRAAIAERLRGVRGFTLTELLITMVFAITIMVTLWDHEELSQEEQAIWARHEATRLKS